MARIFPSGLTPCCIVSLFLFCRFRSATKSSRCLHNVHRLNPVIAAARSAWVIICRHRSRSCANMAGQRKPSIFSNGSAIKAQSAGGTILCTEKTEKFLMPFLRQCSTVAAICRRGCLKTNAHHNYFFLRIGLGQFYALISG